MMRDFLARLRGYITILQFKIFQRNIRIGRGLKLYNKLRIRGEGQIRLGRNCTIGGARGDDRQYVTIDTHNRDAVIQIGDNVSLYAARISAKYEIAIGDDVLIEESGVLDTDFHSLERSRKTPDNEEREKSRIVIGARVSIGTRSFIVKGVKIGDDVIIIPGSVVTTSIKSGSIICGNPARLSVH